MKLLDNLKVRSALLKHQRGNKDEARMMYEKLYEDGVVQAAYMLPYSVLLLRDGGEENFQKVREVLVKAQKAPDLSEEKRQQLLMNYAIAVWKLGDLDKAIATLEASHQKAPNSLTYQSLGFLYIETGNAQKALDYNMEALEYDDEDGITLDNLGQIHYRLLNDPEAARPYFEKAHQLKPKQIDTLYFLALLDEADGKYQEAEEKVEVALDGNFSPLNFVTVEKARALYERLLKAQGKDLPENQD